MRIIMTDMNVKTNKSKLDDILTKLTTDKKITIDVNGIKKEAYIETIKHSIRKHPDPGKNFGFFMYYIHEITIMTIEEERE